MQKQKKLFVLGATSSMADTVRIAKDMGLYTIVAATPISPAIRDVADKIYDISTAEKEELFKICEREQIDGIYTSMSDLNPYIACWLCEKLHLPYYATEQQLNECNDKAGFKAFCRKYGVSVPQDWDVDENSSDSVISSVALPVVIKPSRSCGTKGVTVCTAHSQIREAIRRARAASTDHNVIVEDYIVGDEVVAYYTIANGKISLSSIADRYNATDPMERSLCQAYSYPSKYLGRFLREMNDAVMNMFLSAGYENAVVSLQMIATGNGFYAFEVGLRPGGTCQYLFTEANNGTNNVRMLIDYAINGRISEGLDHDSADFSKHCGTLTINGNPGMIGKISGLEKIRSVDGVIRAFQMKLPGDTLPNDISMNRIVFWVYMVQPTSALLKKTIQEVQQSVIIESASGKDMVSPPFDSGRIPDLFPAG